MHAVHQPLAGATRFLVDSHHHHSPTRRVALAFYVDTLCSIQGKYTVPPLYLVH